MAGKSPHEAVENYLRPLRRALSCVTKAGLQITGRHPGPKHSLTLGGGPPVPLRGGLALTVEQRYEVVQAEGERGPWKVSTLAYIYALDDAESGHEVIAYHWHPDGRSSEARPHLHLGAGAGVTRSALGDAHLPTNRVALEDVVRLAITDLGVEPLRVDWRDVLWESQIDFETWGTWGQPAGEPPRQ